MSKIECKLYETLSIDIWVPSTYYDTPKALEGVCRVNCIVPIIVRDKYFVEFDVS